MLADPLRTVREVISASHHDSPQVSGTPGIILPKVSWIPNAKRYAKVETIFVICKESISSKS